MNEHLNTNANVYLLTSQMCICQVRKPRLRLDEYATRVEVGTFLLIIFTTTNMTTTTTTTMMTMMTTATRCMTTWAN